MSKPKDSIISKIRSYSVADKQTKAETADMIKFAKRAAKLVNNRLYKLEKAGLSSKATTGGIKHIPLSGIKTRASAMRAIAKAKTVINNPLSTPGVVRKMFREAEREYGKGGRMKFIAEEVPVLDSEGNPTGVTKLVPKAVPWGTNRDERPWMDVTRAIRRFWAWYDEIGSNFLTSEEAYEIWERSGYNDKAAIIEGEDEIANKGMEIAAEYEEALKSRYGYSKWY